MLTVSIADGFDMYKLKAARFRDDVDPRELPIYTPADAARYLGVTRSTLATWIYGRKFPGGFWPRVITPADPENRLLSFYNLAEAHVLCATRYKHKVSFKAVRRAIETLQNKYPSPHPLISKDFTTNGKDIFLQSVEETENLSTPGQLNLKPILDKFLQHIDRDVEKLVNKVYPIIKGLPEDKVISITHGVSSSRPVIDGYGVPVWVIYDRKVAGDTPAAIAQDFGVPKKSVQRAIDYVEQRGKQRAA